MASQLGPIDVLCDAPPYPIVQACHMIGIREPEDVRWLRKSLYLSERPSWRELINQQSWKALLNMNQNDRRGCTCGSPAPSLDRCKFTLNTGREICYLIGQCNRCRTIFWDEP